jgi:hypothetical protein
MPEIASAALAPLREQRAQRAVDQARGERLELARAAFTLEEAARDLAGGVGLLDVVDGQREEVLARLGLGLGHHGGKDHGVLDVDEHRAAGLASDLAGLQRDAVLAPLEGLGDFVEHAHWVLQFLVFGDSWGVALVPGAAATWRDAIPAAFACETSLE